MISNNQSIELDIYTSSTLERILHDIKHSRSGYASRIVPLPSLPLLPLLPSMPSMPSITAITNQQLTSLYESSDFTTGTCMQDYLHSHFIPNIETHLYSVSTPPRIPTIPQLFHQSIPFHATHSITHPQHHLSIIPVFQSFHQHSRGYNGMEWSGMPKHLQCANHRYLIQHNITKYQDPNTFTYFLFAADANKFL